MYDIRRKLDYVGKLIDAANCDGQHDDAILQTCKIAKKQLECIIAKLEPQSYATEIVDKNSKDDRSLEGWAQVILGR